MITNTERLLNTQNMTIKETNHLARRLETHYFKLQKKCQEKKEKTEYLSDTYFYYAYKINALMGLQCALTPLSYCERRSKKMILDLESAMTYAKDKGVILL